MPGTARIRRECVSIFEGAGGDPVPSSTARSRGITHLVLDAERGAEERHERPRRRRAGLAEVDEARRGGVLLRERRGDGEALALDVLDQRVVLVVARRRALEPLAF